MSRRLLQVVVAVLALVPVSAGLAGVVTGTGFLDRGMAATADIDSHVRFLSGVFLALGLTFWSCVPDIGRKTARFRGAAALIVMGGLARLLSLGLAGPPSWPHLAGLGLELGVVPLLIVWQTRVAGHDPR